MNSTDILNRTYHITHATIGYTVWSDIYDIMLRGTNDVQFHVLHEVTQMAIEDILNEY